MYPYFQEMMCTAMFIALFTAAQNANYPSAHYLQNGKINCGKFPQCNNIQHGEISDLQLPIVI